jgi:hypothetical protein
MKRRAAVGLGVLALSLAGTIVTVGAGGCSSNSAASSGDAGPATTATNHEDAGAPTDDSGSPPSGSTGDDGESDGGAGPLDAGGDAPTGASGDGGRDYSTDPSRFLGASRCADSGLQLCEDFETGSLNKAVWAVNGGTPVIDTMEAARGTHALHVTQHGDGLTSIKETVTFPEPHDTYFGRVFVYFKSLPSGAMYEHWTMLAASGTGIPGEIRVSGQYQSGQSLFGVGTDNRTDGGSGDWTNSDDDPEGKPVAVPLDKWLCIEWMHKGDTNETAFWWDAVPHPSLSTDAGVVHGGMPKNPYLLPEFNQVWIGWQEYQTTSEVFESWIDEIAIDVERIGCVQ